MGYGAVVFPSHEDAFNYELLNALCGGALPHSVTPGHQKEASRRKPAQSSQPADDDGSPGYKQSNCSDATTRDVACGVSINSSRMGTTHGAAGDESSCKSEADMPT